MKEYDFVVIGSGIAGLSFALKAAKHGSVAVVTKRKGADTNTVWAQGGIACVTSDEDSFELHVRDTLEAVGFEPAVCANVCATAEPKIPVITRQIVAVFTSVLLFARKQPRKHRARTLQLRDPCFGDLLAMFRRAAPLFPQGIPRSP